MTRFMLRFMLHILYIISYFFPKCKLLKTACDICAFFELRESTVQQDDMFG